MGKMFSEVSETWNPLGGECFHQCVYCWARKLAKEKNMQKYVGEPRLIEKEFNRKFKDGSFVFVQDMTDLFADNVPKEYIVKVLDYVKKFPNVTFLFLTKNPRRYYCVGELPQNAIYGASIETNRVENNFSEAPNVWERSGYLDVLSLHGCKTMVSVEPILDFDLVGTWNFVRCIRQTNPDFVYVGFDNYNNNLPEPEKLKVQALVDALRTFTEVRLKDSAIQRGIK